MPSPQTKLFKVANPWLPGHGPGAGLARALIRSDADRAEVEKHAPNSLLPASTIHGCIQAAQALAPDKVAIIYLESADSGLPPRNLSYRELLSGIERSACLFAKAAQGKTPIVSTICPVHPEAMMAMWGAETVGIVNPINPFLGIEAVISIMNSIQANVLVIATSKFGSGAWDHLDEIVSQVPSLCQVFLIGAEPGDARNFTQALSEESGDGFATLCLRQGTDDATYMPTGGTTGSPKLVRHTQEKQLLNAWLMGALNGSSPAEVVGHGMPNFHVGGLVCTSLRAMIFGQTLVILSPDGFRNPRVVAGFWPIASRFGITNVIATPTTAAALLGDPTSNHEQHCIHTFSCGGSTVPTELLHAFYRRFGLYLRELWGMTEFHGVITGHPNDGGLPVVGSVGRRFAFHHINAVKLEDGRFAGEVAPGEKGVLIAKGACVGEGYFGDGLSAALFVKDMPDGEVWASTGDIGMVDDAGQVWVFGREKDLIIRGGHKIDPRVIEEALQHHPAVLISAAIGRPDATRGEMPIAYVQLRTDAQVTAEELIAFCREKISERAAVPLEIVVLNAMPMTAVGKIAKPALRADALRRVAMDVASEVIGKASITDLVLDEASARPVVVIRLNLPQAQAAQADERLRAAFMGFSFQLRTEYQPAKAAS